LLFPKHGIHLQKNILNWDDIRIFVSVSKERSFSITAKKNHTTQATVSRRIQSLEQQLELNLFVRGQDGCCLTKEGQSLLKAAKEMASWAEVFETETNKIRDQDLDIVITCGPLLGMFLSSNLQLLYQASDGINIEIRATPDYLDLEKGEADIAIRNSRPTTGKLKIKRLNFDYFSEFCVYGDRKYFSRVRLKTTKAFQKYNWVGYTKSLSHLSSAKWLSEQIEKKNIRFKVNSSSFLAKVIQSNKALAILPRFIGQEIQTLTEVYGPINALNVELWLLRRDELHDKKVKKVSRSIEKLLKNNC